MDQYKDAQLAGILEKKGGVRTSYDTKRHVKMKPSADMNRDINRDLGIKKSSKDVTAATSRFSNTSTSQKKKAADYYFKRGDTGKIQKQDTKKAKDFLSKPVEPHEIQPLKV